jgi:RimJ/RimL family protein N-acetyltransferase
VAYRNDPEVAHYQNLGSLSAPRAQTMIAEQRHLEPGVPGHWFQFAIELMDDGQLAGDCGLQVTLQDARQAQIGITLALAYQGRGLATEAATLLLDYAFINLDLHRVVAVVDAENLPATRLMERLGMRREGHFVKNTWIKGRWADEYLYAILQSEWLTRDDRPANSRSARLAPEG